MTVQLRPDRTETELVATVMDALLKRENLNELLPIVQADFGLTEEDVKLAFDRVQGGIVRALSGSADNQPDKVKDPLAWHSFKRVWDNLPRVGWWSNRKKPRGPWLDWFEEVRRLNSTES